MTPPAFDAFLGIDWSGAKGRRLHGLRVARCTPGRGSPVLLDGPRPGGLWRRGDVLALIEAAAAGADRVLAGFDFAFAYAHDDAGAYFPGATDAPADVWRLWETVERLAGDGADLYAGAVYAPASPLHGHYLSPHGTGTLYTHRRRATEIACAAHTAPHPVFKCIGAANVGTGSLAGMRLLHRLAGRVAVWPFAEPGAVTVVEIFPRLYFKRAKADPRAWRDAGVVNAALAAYGSEPYAGPPLDIEDKADAVISAAALRGLASDPAVWSAPAAAAAARREGWIFGVEPVKPGAT